MYLARQIYKFFNLAPLIFISHSLILSPLTNNECMNDVTEIRHGWAIRIVLFLTTPLYVKYFA